MEDSEIKTGIIIQGKRYTIDEARETYNFLKQFFDNDKYPKNPVYPYIPYEPNPVYPFWEYKPGQFRWEIT